MVLNALTNANAHANPNANANHNINANPDTNTNANVITAFIIASIISVSTCENIFFTFCNLKDDNNQKIVVCMKHAIFRQYNENEKSATL
jgi:hypothetical protein